MSGNYSASAGAAYEVARQNAARRYPARTEERYSSGLLFPAVSPTFKIPSGSTVFTIGSCFARNVEESLAARGVDVPALGFSVPDAEDPGGRSNRALNQYNMGTMLQAVKAVRLGVPEAGYFEGKDGQVVDGLLATRSAVTVERAGERRKEIVDLYRSGLQAAETVVITLGLVEAWLDTKHDLYLNLAPDPRQIRNEPERYRFVRLGVTECIEMLEAMVDELGSIRKSNIVLTVSPVPLASTFMPEDCVVANTYSKAVLRVAADEIARNHSNIDYFPSYEIASTAGMAALDGDNIHVRSKVVERIVNYMLQNYSADANE